MNDAWANFGLMWAGGCIGFLLGATWSAWRQSAAHTRALKDKP